MAAQGEQGPTVLTCSSPVGSLPGGGGVCPLFRKCEALDQGAGGNTTGRGNEVYVG